MGALRQKRTKGAKISLVTQEGYTALLASIVHSSDDAIIGKTMEGVITIWNRAAELMYGYAEDEIVGKPVSVLLPPDRAGEMDEILERISRGERVDHCETLRKRKDGTIVHVSLTVSPICDSSDRLIGASSIARDITERKRAEEQLRATSQYARSLIEASLDPLVTISPEGKITDVNEATIKVTGTPREQLIGKDFSDYFTEPENARKGYERVFAKGFVTDYPLTIRHKDGRLTDVLYNASVYRDVAGNVLGVFAAARDMTAQRQAAQYARSLIEASLDPLVTISAAGKIMDVNRATELVTGVSREQLIGTDFSNYFTEPEKAREGYLQVFEKGSISDYSLAIRHALGPITDVVYNAAVYKGACGEVEGIFAAARDITLRKRAEKALKRYTKELERSSAKLERKNQELQEFAFVASHDLSEPLRKIQTFGTLLESKNGDNLTEQSREYISRMTGAANRMQELLDALLRYSRVDSKGQEFRPVRLDDVARDSLADLDVAIRKIEARVEIGGLPIVSGDPYQLRQLFQNLIANAVKYHRSEVKPAIKIYCQDVTGHIFVEDNGIGFDEKYLDKIFQPFQRLHGRNEYPGTGIGLAICKKIVERHGGTITAKSTPGKGSTFIVTLPVDGTTSDE